MLNEDLEILSSLLSSIVTNRHVENSLRAMHLKRMSKFSVFFAKNADFSAFIRHKKINEGLNEASILCL